jgi:hypothetical protein
MSIAASGSTMGSYPISNTTIRLQFGDFPVRNSGFVLMAIKEFLQDTLGITERDLLAPPPKKEPPGPRFLWLPHCLALQGYLPMLMLLPPSLKI